MTIIAPSLLSADFLQLKEEIIRFNHIENLWMHLDVMDGHFVPNLTFGSTVLKNIKNVTDLKLDAHFMVSNPEVYIDQFKDVGLHNFTFHLETTNNPIALIELAKKVYPSVGVSINPATPVSDIPQSVLKNIDLILVMTVNPGFGGQSFMNDCIDKVQVLKELKNKNNYHYLLEVDGGINQETSKIARAKGADILVAGSFIFREPNKNYEAQIKKLLN
jgi:ribulose-phosphate 3-epimerase